MSKMKTKSGAKKRFRMTGSGKVRMNSAFMRHMQSNKHLLTLKHMTRHSRNRHFGPWHIDFTHSRDRDQGGGTIGTAMFASSALAIVFVDTETHDTAQ